MTFQLSEMEQRTLQSMNSISQVHEYGLRNMNVARIRPDGTLSPNDQTITFTLDSSNLAGNIPLNRIEAEVDFKVTVTGNLTPAAITYNATPTDGWITSPLANAHGYLMSLSNGAMDSLCVNKAFSSIEISNGQVSLAKDSRDSQRIEILSRMLSQENLREAGVYPENYYGTMDNKEGGQYELIPLRNYIGAPLMWARGCDPDKTVQENLFYKRNTNGQYIVSASDSTFLTSAGAPIASAANPFPWDVVASGNPVGKVYEWVTNGTFSGATQTRTFKVREELLHDILASKYQVRPMYNGLPTSQLVFTFTVSSLLDSLYKTSSTKITNVQVQITDMKLNVLTYNHGLLAIEPKTYFVPFYSEKSDNQAVVLRDNAATTNITLNTLRYNSMPEYVVFWCSEPSRVTGTNLNKQLPLTTNKITDIQLSIDNDIGGALYSMTIDELKHRTLTNLDWDSANVESLFRSHINMCQGIGANAASFEAARGWGDLNGLELAQRSNNGRAYLEGLYVLKIGKDIRIPANMNAGVHEKVSFTWKINFSQTSNPYVQASNNQVQCQVYTIAYFPAYYKFSHTEGLLRADTILMSTNEFDEMVKRTNSMIRSSQNSRENKQYYSHDQPMLMGSGFYGGLNIIDTARAALPFARKALEGIRSVARVARDFTADIDHDVARAIHKGSKFVTDVLGDEDAVVAVAKRGRKAKRPLSAKPRRKITRA